MIYALLIILALLVIVAGFIADSKNFQKKLWASTVSKDEDFYGSKVYRSTLVEPGKVWFVTDPRTGHVAIFLSPDDARDLDE
jgi:hypothetical protein